MKYLRGNPPKKGAFKMQKILSFERREDFTMKYSSYSDHQIMDILNRAAAGVAILDLCREHGVIRTIFYK